MSRVKWRCEERVPQHCVLGARGYVSTVGADQQLLLGLQNR